MPIENNEIKDNTGKIYLLKNGMARDPLNLDSYHPLSTTDGFMPHIEDGVAGNIVLANYRPNKKAVWASHWFPLWYRGLTEKQITGEGYSRTFAQYFSYIPSILSAMNKNADAIMDVDVTIVQYNGDNLIGGYSSVLALETAHPATEELNLDHAVAYVYDLSEKGFYTSQWNTEDEVWEWTKVTMPLQSYGVQMKQYNTFTIKVQRGFAPTDAQYNTTWTDEQIRLTWQEMAYLEATLAEHTELLATFGTHLTDYENPHQVTAKQATFDPTGSDLVSVDAEEAIKEVNVKANANAQNIEKIVDGTTIVKKAEQDKNGNDIVDTYETKSDATSKLALKADKTYVDAQDQALDGRVGDLETANMIKSIARTGSNLITITYYDDTTSTVITLSELKAFIGEATTSLSGLMSAQDKTDLDTLMALFDSDADDVVNTIAEILAIFEEYPEGVDLVTALAGKEDVTNKVTSWQATPTDTAYPSEKLVKDNLDLKVAKTDIVNDLTTGGTTKVLSAEQGKILKGITDDLEAVTDDHETRLDVIEETDVRQDLSIKRIEETLRKSSGDTAEEDGTSIIHLGSDVANAPVKVEVEGMILDAEQLLTNGDFSNGTVGITNIGSTSTVSGSNLTNIADGTANFPYIHFGNNSIVAKIYAITKVRVLGTLCTELALRGYKTSGLDYYGTPQANPVQNQWYILSGLLNQGIANQIIVAVRHLYTTSGDASGKQMEVDYAYAFNISTLQANKQYSPMFNTTFDLMSDANIKSQMDAWVKDGTLPNDLMAVAMDKRFRAVGKNLFDKSKVERGFWLNNSTWQKEASSGYALSPYIQVKPSTTYFIGNTGSGRLRLFDSLFQPINQTLVINNTIVTPSNAKYIRITIEIISNDNLLNTFQLELGSTSTQYEAYQHSDMYLRSGEMGYRVPNGTKDTIEMRDGKAYFVRRVKKYTLQASDITNFDNTSWTNIEIFRITKPSDFIHALSAQNSVSTAFAQYIPNTKQYYYGTTYDSLDRIGDIMTNYAPAQWVKAVAKGTYASLAKAQADLAGTDIYYQLATPIETEIDIDNVLYGLPNGTIYIDDVVEDADIYTTNITVTNPILTLEEIVKIANDGTQTKLAVSGATVAGDGLSFTHTGLTAGDKVWFSYKYRGTNIKGTTTVTYYDDDRIVADSVTGTVYKIIFTIANGVITVDKVEV